MMYTRLGSRACPVGRGDALARVLRCLIGPMRTPGRGQKAVMVVEARGIVVEGIDDDESGGCALTGGPPRTRWMTTYGATVL